MKSVRDLLKDKSVYSVSKDATVQDAAEHMSRHNIGAVTVMDNTRLVGIFSERDVINRVVARKMDPSKTTVASVMTSNIVVAAADETNVSCLKKMKAANCRHLPVVEGDTLLGMISVRDLLQVELSEKDDELQFLNDYMFHLPPGLEKKYRS